MNLTTDFKSFTILLVCFLLSVTTKAQITAGGTPTSFSEDFQTKFYSQDIASVKIPAFDLEKAKTEDKKLEGTVRFAAPIKVNYTLDTHGSWTVLDNGDRIWRLKLRSENAMGVFVYYEDFYLPPGATFYMYNEDHTQVFGAYTHRNNKDSGKFLTGMIEGETAILEYYEPFHLRGQGIIDIAKIYHAYQNDYIKPVPEGVFSVYSGFGDALPCNVNVNCPEGDDWQDHKRGVVKILRVFDEGMGWCSGSLINNTNEDATPYILSAFHCIAGFTPQLDVWRFDFNYETAGCGNPTNEPDYDSMLGCMYRSGREETDFMLLELLEPVPFSYNARFNGWNRNTSTSPDTGTVIHHPRGDIKKISMDNDSSSIFPNSINWSNGVITPPNHHFELFLDIGTIEDGSSGSSLYDEDGYIVGQLHGGNANCVTFQTFFGRFALSWDEGSTAATRLQDWLDPANTGQITLGHYEPEQTIVTISGNVKARTGQDMVGTQVFLSGDATDSLITDANGNYSFEVAAGGDYTITPFKNNNPLNGVSGFDVIFMTSHILQINPFTDPYQLIAGDANDNGNITAFDLVQVRRLILVIDEEFPNSNSWRFANESISINDIMEDTPDQDFIGIKIGDVSGNADPNQ